MSALQLLGRALVVVVFAAAVGAIAYAISDSQEERYAATTRLLFGPPSPELRALGFQAESDEEERSLANRVEAADSFDIARRTAEALNDPEYDADAVASAIQVTGERTADIVTIVAETSSPEESAELVGEYRRQFILRQQEIIDARAREARATLRAVLSELPPRQRTTQRGDILRSQLGTLRVLERTGGEPIIIEGVRAFADPVAPKTERNTLFGLLFGALLGIGLVSLRQATRPKRDPAD